jgi:hypothetical protein
MRLGTTTERAVPVRGNHHALPFKSQQRKSPRATLELQPYRSAAEYTAITFRRLWPAVLRQLSSIYLYESQTPFLQEYLRFRSGQSI